jgi:hypothetical protein
VKGRHHSQDLGVDGSIILEWSSREIGWDDVYWIHMAQSKGPVAGSFEYSN